MGPIGSTETIFAAARIESKPSFTSFDRKSPNINEDNESTFDKDRESNFETPDLNQEGAALTD